MNWKSVLKISNCKNTIGIKSRGTVPLTRQSSSPRMQSLTRLENSHKFVSFLRVQGVGIEPSWPWFDSPYSQGPNLQSLIVYIARGRIFTQSFTQRKVDPCSQIKELFPTRNKIKGRLGHSGYEWLKIPATIWEEGRGWKGEGGGGKGEGGNNIFGSSPPAGIRWPHEESREYHNNSRGGTAYIW